MERLGVSTTNALPVLDAEAFAELLNIVQFGDLDEVVMLHSITSLIEDEIFVRLAAVFAEFAIDVRATIELVAFPFNRTHYIKRDSSHQQGIHGSRFIVLPEAPRLSIFNVDEPFNAEEHLKPPVVQALYLDLEPG